jgi:hypothetical protein
MGKINKENVYVCFQKTKSPWKRLKIKLFKLEVSSMLLCINGCPYTLRHSEQTVQKEILWGIDYIESKYIVIDTGFKASDLKEGWEKELLSQKARALDSLFMRHRCVRSAKCILNQLDKKWHYRFGDMFVNLYYKRRKNEQ